LGNVGWGTIDLNDIQPLGELVGDHLEEMLKANTIQVRIL
jgi:hypothetical protein